MLLKTHVRKLLVNGEQWASWDGYHIPMNEDYFAVWTPIGTQMNWKPGIWSAHKHLLTYFWQNSWYTIQIGYNQAGEFVSGYCDIVLPASDYTNTATAMIYTDLYIDVVIREDYTVYTKDQEVFDEAARHYPIVEQAREKAFEALDWLEAQAKTWSGPFVQLPRKLPRTDFAQMNPEEAAALLKTIAK